MNRATSLQDFLDLTATAMRATTTGPAALAAAKAEAAWATVAGPTRQDGGVTLPVCDWLDPALQVARGGPRAALAGAFAALADGLIWRRRQSADPANATYWNGHANAMVLGPGGLEDRGDVWVGATIMAPEVLYPDHNHPPEEVYLPLTPGQWWNAQMDWTDPGQDGFIYNPPAILHAMRSGPGPFLALWVLPA